MSYILDALKKAERDRRGRVPTLGTMHAPAAVRRRPLWPWIAGGALAVNAVALVVVLHGIGTAPRPVEAPPASRADATASASNGAQGSPAQQITPPGSVAQPVALPARSEPIQVSRRPAAPAPSVAAPAIASKRAAAADKAVGSRARLEEEHPRPSPAPVEHPAGRLSTATRANGADLKLDVLVYADDPAQRSAWINGQRYVEGQRVTGRLAIETITPDTVVLTGEGQRMLLRQQ